MWIAACVCLLFVYLFLCPYFYPVQHDKMKFLVIGTKNGVEVYAWAQRPYSKFMAFKVSHSWHCSPAVPHSGKLGEGLNLANLEQNSDIEFRTRNVQHRVLIDKFIFSSNSPNWTNVPLYQAQRCTLCTTFDISLTIVIAWTAQKQEYWWTWTKWKWEKDESGVCLHQWLP